MNADIYMSKINDLKVNYIIQLVLCGIILIFNFILLFKIIWLYKLFYYLYLSLSIFGIFYLIVPIIPLIFILLKRLNKFTIKRFKILSLIFCFLSMITGLSFSFILFGNSLEFTDFCRECPFNLQYSYINNVYNNYVNNNLKEKILKEQCTNRRCLFNNEISDNQYKYEYICNYEPFKEFDPIKANTSSNDTINQLECTKIDKKDINYYKFEKDEIYKFYEMCDTFLDEYYICQRINEPKVYSLKENYICPNKDYFTYLIIFCITNILFNLILNFLLWRAEYIKYKEIIKFLRGTNSNRITSNSLNSTQNTSQIQKEKKEESFKKEKTEIIIVCTEENFINNNNNINKSTNDIERNNNIKLSLNYNNSSNNIYHIKKNISNINESKKEDINSINIFNINEHIHDIKEKEKNNNIKNTHFDSNNNQSSSERTLVQVNEKIPEI